MCGAQTVSPTPNGGVGMTQEYSFVPKAASSVAYGDTFPYLGKAMLRARLAIWCAYRRRSLDKLGMTQN